MGEGGEEAEEVKTVRQGHVGSREDFIKMEEITAISFADGTDEGAKKKRRPEGMEFVDL